jgi:hypothetical protein
MDIAEKGFYSDISRKILKGLEERKKEMMMRK